MKPLVCVVGPSGSGKSSVVSRLIDLYPDMYSEAVSTTTRAPREGENHGVNYFYVTTTEFKRLLEEGDLLEDVEFSGNFYGVQKSEIHARTASGKTTFIVVEPSGLLQIRSRYDGFLLSVFISAPENVLEKRMKSRGDSDESIRKRLENDRDYFSSFDVEYDYSLVSGPLDEDAIRLHDFLSSCQHAPAG